MTVFFQQMAHLPSGFAFDGVGGIKFYKIISAIKHKTIRGIADIRGKENNQIIKLFFIKYMTGSVQV